MSNREGYLGNPLLKPANEPVNFTQEQVQEYIKCSQDPVYFINKYVKIVNVDKGLIPFDMYDYQENLVRTLNDNRFVICRFSRQTGKSTSVGAFMLHYIIFNANKVTCILANKLSTAKEILDRIKRMFENLPRWLQQGVKEWNKTSIVLENDSKVIAAATSSSAIRGLSINLIMLDEFAFVPQNQAEDFYTSVFPTISSGKETKVFVVSTPNGMNHFYKMWDDAENGRSDYVPVKITWRNVPGRDEEWALQQIRQTSQMQFDQEHEVEFLGSANTLISGPILRSLVPRPEKYCIDNLSVLEEPVSERTYCLVADVSRGAGIDYSAFLVIDITEVPYRIVARYRNNFIPPLVYPDVIYRTAKKYNNAWVLVEVNDAGGQVCDSLYNDYEYENLITVSTRGRKGQVADSGFGANVGLGIKTSPQVKRIGCQALKTLVEDQKIIIDEFDTISELSTFIARGNTFEADIGSHDDLAMCLVLFAWLTSQPIFKELTNDDVREILYKERMERIENEMTPFGFIVDGVTEETFVDNEGIRWTTFSEDKIDSDWGKF